MGKHTKEQIQSIAESILPGFIPKDATEQHLTFHFTIPPNSSYKVSFAKDAKGKWNFDAYNEDSDNM